MAEHIIAAGVDGSRSAAQRINPFGPEQTVSNAVAALTVWIDAATRGCALDSRSDAANTLQFTISRIAESIEEDLCGMTGAEDEDVFCAKQFLHLIDLALWNFVGGEVKTPPDLNALVTTARLASAHLSRIASAMAEAKGGAQ